MTGEPLETGESQRAGTPEFQSASTRPRAGSETLGAELAALRAMDATTLRAAWRRLYRSDPPRSMRRDLLARGVAWKLQERVHGGHSAAVRRRLAELAAVLDAKSDLPTARAASLRPGARLIRAWNGDTHEVLVTEEGFLWQGKMWASLSVIAREITGTRWSGPRFFGIGRSKAVPAEANASVEVEP